MKIEMWPTEKPVPYEKNPRRNDAAVKYVANSIEQFGFRVPIIVDSEGVIIAGHTRLKAAKKLKLKEVPVHVAGDLDATQAKALRLADNKVSERAEWDNETLLQEIVDLRELGMDEALLGFEADEVAALFGEEEDAGKTDEDAVPDVQEEPQSVLGVVYRLGDHRLMCGSSTDKNDVLRLMSGQKADLWITDPPYNVAYVGKTKDSLTIENDSMDDDAFLSFLTDAYCSADAAMREGAAFYVWHADSEGLNFRMAAKVAGWKARQCLVWKKSCLVMGRQDYQWMHEPCLYGWKPGAAHFWGSDRKQTTILEFDKPSRSACHPTMKPVELFEYQIKNSSRSGDVVMDSFCGSGTTIIACEKSGRVARCMELSPHYCDVIRRRWAEFVHGEGCDWQALTPVVEEQSEG